MRQSKRQWYMLKRKLVRRVTCSQSTHSNSSYLAHFPSFESRTCLRSSLNCSRHDVALGECGRSLADQERSHLTREKSARKKAKRSVIAMRIEWSLVRDECRNEVEASSAINTTMHSGRM